MAQSLWRSMVDPQKPAALLSGEARWEMLWIQRGERCTVPLERSKWGHPQKQEVKECWKFGSLCSVGRDPLWGESWRRAVWWFHTMWTGTMPHNCTCWNAAWLFSWDDTSYSSLQLCLHRRSQSTWDHSPDLLSTSFHLGFPMISLGRQCLVISWATF